MTTEYCKSWKVCMRDADCGLLWSIDEPGLNGSVINMDHKGRLFCLSEWDKDIQIWEVEFHEENMT